MSIVNLSNMINHAKQHKYAIGAFGIANLQFLEGIMQAAENCRSPVVLNLIESHFEHYDFELLVQAITAAASRASIPVAVNFDHGKSIASAERAIRAGCNGVMVDTSALPLSDNIWQTRDIVKLAHACGVTVEGELGYVPGVEGESSKQHPGELAYTSAAEAVGFVERTGVDCLAISIGTVHGRMKGAPRLDYARLAKIREAVVVPLVVHGGSGLTDDQFRRLIANGISKINYYTALADVASSCIREKFSEDRKGDHSVLVSGVRDAVRKEAERCMQLWGCGGRAAEVLAQCKVWSNLERIVLHNIPASLSESEITSIMSEGKESLKTIPGVIKVRTGKVVKEDGRYRYCWLIRLASREALEAYKMHPAHQLFVSKILHSVADDRFILDFECLD